MDTLKGCVERVIFRNRENGYTVLSVENNDDTYVCVGSFQEISAGEFMEFSGEFAYHPKYGEQFKAQFARSIIPDDLESIERYLGSGAIKGIGAVTAKRIIARFGSDTLRILDEEPERLAEIKGITRKKALEIASSQEEKKDMRNAMIFMGDYGISNALAVKLYGQYGQDIYTIIRDNPYQLADEVNGMGFKKADEIAFKAGIDPGSDFRIKACMIYELQHALDNGHTYLPDNILKQKVLATLQPSTMDDVCEIEDQDLERCLMDLAIDSRVIIKSVKMQKKSITQALENAEGKPAGNSAGNTASDSVANAAANSVGNSTDNSVTNSASPSAAQDGVNLEFYGNDLQVRVPVCEGTESNQDESRQIYYSQNYYTELGIARMMVDLNLKTDIDDSRFEARINEVEASTKIKLDELQRQAIRAAVNSGILIITGGPGTGKTTTINALIKYFEDDKREILLAAPTGRAAKRMTEATGYEAKTIHRMLELSTKLDDTSAGARFNRNEESPLEADVIIVDEMSMVDIFLMNALLRAIAPGTRLILVGDVDQLPSVGAGNVLKDLIDSGRFNTVKLVKIFRQAEESEIVVNAHKINNGEPIVLKSSSKDFIFLKRETPQAVASAVLTLVRDKLPKYVNTDIKEIQVLSPMKNGTLGVIALNKFLQTSLNPAAPDKKELAVGSMVFREGDKVMHIKNNYDLEWEMRTAMGFAYDKGTGVFNGDIGIINQINEHRQMLEVIFDDGKYVIYGYEQLEELTLSYAATVHKSQGSEYPAVILPLLTGPQILMNRNILYTAVTRAKKCVVIVGNDEVVERMIENTREQERYTGLKDRVREIVL